MYIKLNEAAIRKIHLKSQISKEGGQEHHAAARKEKKLGETRLCIEDGSDCRGISSVFVEATAPVV